MKASLVVPDHVFAPLAAFSLVDPLLVGCPEGLVAEDLVILESKLSQLLYTFGHRLLLELGVVWVVLQDLPQTVFKFCWVRGVLTSLGFRACNLSFFHRSGRVVLSAAGLRWFLLLS